MRQLQDHAVIPHSSDLRIEVVDNPGIDGTCHHYRVTGFDTRSNPSDPFAEKHGEPAVYSTVLFQNGTVNSVGSNGVTQEALLAILIDRLRLFQAGEYSCRENAIALTHLEDALHWLHHRTRNRMQRGVEGTMQK